MNREFAEQKRQLIARGDQYRHVLAADLREATESVAWIPRSLRVWRAAAPILAVAAPLGWAFFHRRSQRPPEAQAEAPPASKPGLFSRAWRGFQIFQQVWPMVREFQRLRRN
jgi:transposase